MTSLALLPCGGETVVEGLARCADELAQLVGGCLVEGADGRLVVHHLAPDAPAAFISSVLSGDARALHAALVSPRTTALLHSGPVVEGLLHEDGPRVAHVLLHSGASVWLLPAGTTPMDLNRAPAVLQQLEELLTCRVEEAEDLAPWLDGEGTAPPAWRGRAIRLARLDAPGVPYQALARSVSCGTAIRHRGAVYVILEPTAQPFEVGASARAVVSAPTTEVVRTRRQLDAALPAVPLGSCLTLAEARPRAVVKHLAESLERLPDLGSDPLGVLREVDAKRGGDLVRTLRAWLDAGGDVAATADVLRVHPNTLRYRLRRIDELLESDLRRDHVTRLELHLRLTQLGDVR